MMTTLKGVQPRLIEGLKDTDETTAQEILALLKLSRKPLTLKDLGEAVDVSPKKARRIVMALNKNKDVNFSPSSDGYLVSLA